MSNSYIEGLKYEANHPFRKAANRASVAFLDAKVDETGVARWTSNNAVPPTDLVEFWAYMNYGVDVEACRVARDTDLDNVLANYRKNYRGPSDEARAEARAAFGPGVELVNVVTGHKYTT